MAAVWIRIRQTFGTALAVFMMAQAGWAKGQPLARPLTLAGCYALALKRSETIAIQQELITETAGRFLQAFSGVLPRASFSSSDVWGEGGRVPERKFTFSQPLFSGFKEFAAMAGSRAERRQRIQEKARAEQLLLVDVSDAFHLLLEQRQDLEALEITRGALVERIEQLEERERLGRSRQSEAVSAEAQLRRVEAELELVRSQETLARQLLEFLIGVPVEAVADDTAIPGLEGEGTYLGLLEARPDVQAAVEAWHVAKQQAAITRSKFWPTANVESNYYTERGGTSADKDWDVTLKLSVPLFQGGQAVGAMREAVSHAREAELTAQRARRSAGLDIEDAYTTFAAAIARHTAFERALEATEEDYRLQVADYQLSLVSNLDVLRALQELQDARRNVIQTQHDVKRAYWRLRAATGQTL